jgi:hypothetical protein
MKIYEALDLRQMNANFNAYTSKILKDVVPVSKAKFVLSRIMVYQTKIALDSQPFIILDHSFVKNSSRHVDFLKSQKFQ